MDLDGIFMMIERKFFDQHMDCKINLEFHVLNGSFFDFKVVLMGFEWAFPEDFDRIFMRLNVTSDSMES